MVDPLETTPHDAVPRHTGPLESANVSQTRHTCTCGHAREAHEHYRPGTECALCVETVCKKFRPAPAKAPTIAAPVVSPARLRQDERS